MTTPSYRFLSFFGISTFNMWPPNIAASSWTQEYGNCLVIPRIRSSSMPPAPSCSSCSSSSQTSSQRCSNKPFCVVTAWMCFCSASRKATRSLSSSGSVVDGERSCWEERFEEEVGEMCGQIGLFVQTRLLLARCLVMEPYITRMGG